MNMDNFETTQLIERERIAILFNNYFKYRKCSNLILTSTEDKNSFDGLFISASTKNILLEIKVRSINLFDRSDCLIEFDKYSNLYPWHLAGNTILFAVEYLNYYAVWNLSAIYAHDQKLNVPLDHYFYEKDCTKTTAENYCHGSALKRVRGLQFHDASFITKDFQPRTYAEVLSDHKNSFK